MAVDDANCPKLAWIGAHQEGVPAFMELIRQGVPPVCVVTLEEEARRKFSSTVDYPTICKEHAIPCLEVSRINSAETINWLTQYKPDLLVVLGWSQILGAALLQLANLGAIGAHASLLPGMRGSAPVNWALIRGMRRTGNTLMHLSENIDDGDILAQREIEIGLRDTCATIYERVAETNRDMLLEVLDDIRRTGRLSGYAQPDLGAELLPRRRPEDGLIDWSLPAADVYNFIRALTYPYPGAFTYLDGQRWLIWEASLLQGNKALAEPGELMGLVVGPGTSGLLVACGKSALLLTRIEGPDEKLYSGVSMDSLGNRSGFFKSR